MEALIHTIKGLNFNDSHIRYTVYNPYETIRDKFSANMWHNLIGEIETDDELRDFFLEYPNYTAGFIVKKDNVPIGFVYIILEDLNKPIISFHGGAWHNSPSAAFSYYRGVYLLIKNLLDLGIKVRTSCLKSNKRAVRFLRSIGFVRYYIGQHSFYFYINRKRMTEIRFYRFLYRTR